MGQVIYKILTVEADAQLQRDASLTQAGIDAADGYIHFSDAAQLETTLEAHFAGHDDLIILAVDAAACGAALRWEPSRDEVLFPHLYGPLKEEMVGARLRLNAARDGLSAFLNGAVA
ncbi:MAG TPA: DUF952 domain-containing protein [Rhodobiaceae bacterium]|nr:DUF952 domain-containing protein [Rhodobiaceae bacterium]|tara:strand:+ start:2074 stop:2424 length:351 start_codon:yes stop_codon:yes gene_type:complete